ncbi:hypothetical protein [Agromyces sp. SYSU T00194]|uniref:hypothetical protein n=1 Tax=Agromyces chitinivorans TaxID=3158560 RepID=UPI003396BE15
MDTMHAPNGATVLPEAAADGRVARFLLLVLLAFTAVTAAAGGIALVVGSLVQVALIPFSALQALYFAIGLAEVGLVLLTLGVFRGWGGDGALRPGSPES